MNATSLGLPSVVMEQLFSEESLALLEEQAGPEARRMVQLLAETGLRAADLCALFADCLDHDVRPDNDRRRHAHPVLVHGILKLGKVGCRLPIRTSTEELIRQQARWMRTMFPNTPPNELRLFARIDREGRGTTPFDSRDLAVIIREWSRGLPRLVGPDGKPFPRERVVPYAFRHTYACRHADAGTPADVLAKLLGHQSLDTTRRYYGSSGHEEAA